MAHLKVLLCFCIAKKQGSPCFFTANYNLSARPKLPGKSRLRSALRCSFRVISRHSCQAIGAVLKIFIKQIACTSSIIWGVYTGGADAPGYEIHLMYASMHNCAQMVFIDIYFISVCVTADCLSVKPNKHTVSTVQIPEHDPISVRTVDYFLCPQNLLPGAFPYRNDFIRRLVLRCRRLAGWACYADGG